MIKEKDLTRTKFFTTNGSDIWKVKAIRTFTLVELLNCETGGTASARVGERSAGGFIAVNMPKVKAAGTKIRTPRLDALRRGNTSVDTKKKDKGKAGKKKVSKSIKPKVTAIGKTGRGVRAGKKSSSQYLGVRAVKGKHYIKYHAQINRGKYVHLGIFKTEEEAAAAVQQYLGNEEEATRLRLMAKKKTQEKIEETKGQTAWMCTKCGAGYDEKPEQCTHCGAGSFTRTRPENKESGVSRPVE